MIPTLIRRLKHQFPFFLYLFCAQRSWSQHFNLNILTQRCLVRSYNIIAFESLCNIPFWRGMAVECKKKKTSHSEANRSCKLDFHAPAHILRGERCEKLLYSSQRILTVQRMQRISRPPLIMVGNKKWMWIIVNAILLQISAHPSVIKSINHTHYGNDKRKLTLPSLAAPAFKRSLIFIDLLASGEYLFGWINT